MNSKAPIVLFCFNRPMHTKKVLENLLKNEEAKDSDLFIFQDGPRSIDDLIEVEKVQQVLQNIEGFKCVYKFFSDKNLGLATSVIRGLDYVFSKDYNSVIVLEDDILVSADFLKFMNFGLSEFSKIDMISSVSGYSYQLEEYDSANIVNLVKRASSWGWGTWKSCWMSVDWQVKEYDSFIKDPAKISQFSLAGNDQIPMLMKQQLGVISSWAIRWTFFHYLTGTYCLVPRKSLVMNIGTDGSGTNFNSVRTNKYDTELNSIDIKKIPSNPEPSDSLNLWIKKKYTPSLQRRLINYFKYKTPLFI